MPKTTKKTTVASIVQKTGVKPSKAKEALETVLDSIKRALRGGRQVDIDKVGRLSVVTRPPKSRISKNLKYVSPTIDRLHQMHPKTVRLIKRQDLSENPQPTLCRPETNCRPERMAPRPTQSYNPRTFVL